MRLALDIVRLARDRQFDVVVIFSQDNDLAEVVEEIKSISTEQDRWIKIVSALPGGSKASAKRGIAGTQWLAMDEKDYNACLDPKDYRPKSP